MRPRINSDDEKPAIGGKVSSTSVARDAIREERPLRRPLRKVKLLDVLTERRVQRPIFTEPKSWEKSVTVNASQPSVVNFMISSK